MTASAMYRPTPCGWITAVFRSPCAFRSAASMWPLRTWAAPHSIDPITHASRSCASGFPCEMRTIKDGARSKVTS